MSLLGNILWIILGGFLSSIVWLFVGCIWCITIIGIPIGIQCFKFARLMFLPFGKDVQFSSSTGHIILNIFWILFSGIELAIMHLIIGALLCIMIIGIPFGLQHFKFAKLSIMPFGATIFNK